ncbi:MAG TPA: AraC family transcriptional regulator [Steroidobacteraceae bacterium]
MIYRAMPAVWDPKFRRVFYARWGHESAVISARTRRAEYPEFKQLLSIKAAVGGAEDYFLDGRRITVDDDTFAIFNHDRVYASRIESLQPVHSFSIFFDRRVAAEAWHSLLKSTAALDEPSDPQRWPVEFAERLYEHENLVSPVLRHIRTAIDAGPVDDAWLEEQLLFLLARMLRLQYKTIDVESVVPSRKPATRRELMRRVSLGVDFMQTRYRDALLLKDIAAAAHLSPFHFLRVFKTVYRLSPSAYLSRKRSAAALRLLRESDWSMNVIAEHVGFGSRTSLYRHLRAHYGVEPRELRSRR